MIKNNCDLIPSIIIYFNNFFERLILCILEDIVYLY